MIVTLETDDGDRTTLFGVSDFHANVESENTVTVFWPNQARKRYDIEQEKTYHAHQVVSGIDETSCDIDTLISIVDGFGTEPNHIIKIVPTEEFAILHELLAVIATNNNFDDVEMYVPDGTDITTIRNSEHD